MTMDQSQPAPRTAPPGAPDLFPTFDAVLQVELADIAKRRKANGLPPPKPMARPAPRAGGERDASVVYDTVGLALSGGGIRSAAVCMGALQGLAKSDVLKHVDYLSTVSGGGYTGAAAILGMSHANGALPFFGVDEKRDTPAMQLFRNNANYLRAGHLGEMLANIAIYARGLAANLLCIMPVLLACAAVTLFAHPTVTALDRAGFAWYTWLDKYLPYGNHFGLTKSYALGLLVVFALWALATVRRPNQNEFASEWPSFGGLLLLGVLLLLFAEVQPAAVSVMIGEIAPNATIKLSPALNSAGAAPLPIVTAEPSAFRGLLDWLVKLSAPLLAAIAFISKYLGDVLKQAEAGSGWKAMLRKGVAKMLVWAAFLILPLALWLAYLVLVYWGVKADRPIPPRAVPHVLDWLFSVVQPLTAVLPAYVTAQSLTYALLSAIGFVLWLFLTANGNSLHRLYRDRLSDAFCLVFEDGGATAKGRTRLSDINTELTPYPLINAALNIQGSTVVNKAGRNADFFLFSPRAVGSAATGYAPTERVEEQATSLRLNTAVAVSGAAVSSNMGSESVRLMAPTLALLNFRLGWWMPNPRHETVHRAVLKTGIHLFYEIFGDLNEHSGAVYLTDGGHIENLGAYELLRRRCALIIVVDAEADRDMNFGALVKLQRYARIDLGARIDIRWQRIRSQALQAQSNTGKPADGPHCAIGKIEYERGGTGTLIYIKSSVTGDENDYIRDYNRRYSDFPHETTGDQFFSEEQFEVYRALGFHMVDGLLTGKHLVETTHTALEHFTAPAAKGWGVRSARARLGLSGQTAARSAARKAPARLRQATRK